MKLSDAVVAWTPVSYATDISTRFGETAGEIVVVAFPDDDGVTDKYAYTGGAVFVAVRALRGMAAIARCFIDFHHLVLRDGIPLAKAHNAFLLIDEYRAGLAESLKDRMPNTLEVERFLDSMVLAGRDAASAKKSHTTA